MELRTRRRHKDHVALPGRGRPEAIDIDLTTLVRGDGTFALRVSSKGVSSNGIDYASRTNTSAGLRPMVVLTFS